ncbi:MAG: discoidin domain-containing protein [Prevotella sp.]|nr:discoidin domain-containing protein [Prevotella sp.]
MKKSPVMRMIGGVMLLMATATTALAQNAISVGGKGSYAEYSPLSKSKTSEHQGDQSQYMQYRKLYIREQAGQPIPTNDWWTDLINADRGRSGQEVTGHLWSYPQYVEGMKYGIDIHYPKYWVDNGTEMKAQSKLTVRGGDNFHAATPMAETWSDWTVTFSEESGSQRMLTTLAHGVPFTWIEMQNISPVITAVKTDNDGADNLLKGETTVTFTDASGHALTSGSHTQMVVRISNATTQDLYGIYLPSGSNVTIADGKATVAFTGEKQFVVVALLQSTSDLSDYVTYAYSKPTDTKVSWNYTQSSGTLTTHWQVQAEDLRTGSATTDVLQGFIPHHWRSPYATFSHSFLGNTYATPRGKLKLAAGNDLSISYQFSGILPWYAVPNDIVGVSGSTGAYDKEKMKTMIASYAQKGEFGADTYWGGKGLTQMALYMSFAREMGEEDLFKQCHDRLKEALVDWMTYTPGEDNFFFAYDRRFHGLIGYDTSYDSDTYNDHHFHYGYFTLAAAMLCLVDDDFKTKYGDMVKLVARDYNNYKRDSWACFLRMMDPWAGHCYAGGMGDGAGNGQESTSESMQAWGGMYLLGVALNDNELRDAGIFGWVNESRATAEYWFDRHGEAIDGDFHTTNNDDYNIDYTKFKHTKDGEVDYTIPYSSNLTSHGVGWWTWFGGDPVFMQGIQWMPISPALDYLGEDKAFANWDYQRLLALKEHKGWDGTGGIGDADLRDSDWGNVVLSYRQWSDPDDAAAIFDEGWAGGWGTMTTSSTNGITYFVTHSHRTYGDIVWDVTANYPTARVFDKSGVKTHVAYNPTDAPITVHYSDGTNLVVPARQMKVEGVESTAYNYVYPVDNSEPDLRERLVMRNLALNKPCTESSHENAGTLKEYATDGKSDTRWGSAHQDNEWIQVDLGENANIYKVRVRWEASYASEYRIELRDTEDGAVTYSMTGAGKANDWTELAIGDHAGRYVRLVGVKRGSSYGTSLYELEVYGQSASAANSDLMGVEITSADQVLKQGQASALTIQGYDYAKNPKSVTAVWSSEDGTFSDNNFTPSKYGNVNVTATVEGMTATKTLPVEESLKLTSIDFDVPAAVIVGTDYPFTVTGKDQFGAEIAVSPTYTSTLTVDAEHKTLRAATVGTYEITAKAGGVSQTKSVLAISEGIDGPATLTGKIPVFVGVEEPPMNFGYNGGSVKEGNIFSLTNDCRVLYVKNLGTCGFGALGNLDLEGANMLHVDIYPINDAPHFSIHIEGAPANKEYAKGLKGGQWNSIDLPITNTTANWLFFAFSNYQAGTNEALIANVYFYTETGDKVYVSDPDSKGLVTVTTFGAGVTNSNMAQFVADLAALPESATAIDLSNATLGNTAPMTITTANPNVMLLLNGDGGDDNAASAQEGKLTNAQNLAYTADHIWYLPLKSTGYKVVFEDGYPVYPVNFGRNTTLTYTRTINAGAYATSCLPREVTAPAGLTVYELTGADNDGITFTKVATGTMAAYKPYLIRNTSETAVTIQITASQGDTFLSRGADDLKVTQGNVSLIGNFQQFHVTGTEGYAAFRPSGQMSWLSNAGTTVGAFRAYLSGVTEEQMARGFGLEGDNETTGILHPGRTTMSPNRYYDLQGREVKSPGKGVFILNGKKMMVK